MSDEERSLTSTAQDRCEEGFSILDGEVVVAQTTFPSGIRDFVLCRRNGEGSLSILNPIELLHTDMAVTILNFLCRHSQRLAVQFSLSRLLVPCLEYSRNTRHLIVEEWDDDDLRGKSFFANNRTQLARDFSVEQASRYQIVMAGAEPPAVPAEELYWGTFSTLPHVEDVFEDEDLGRMAIQLLTLLENEIEGNSIPILVLRSLVRSRWSERFGCFELDCPVRQRRNLFRKLMSVAVRQASTMTRQTAFAIIINGLTPESRQQFELNNQEERLLEIRYGSYEPLGKINVGFLFGDGELHTELLNNLARSLVSGEPDAHYEGHEQRLYRHVQLLHEFRVRRRAVWADERYQSRHSRQSVSPSTRVQPENQADSTSPSPDRRMISEEELLILLQVVTRLKPRDRERVQAIIDSKGDKRAAAALLNQDPVKFLRRYRQTTKENARRIYQRILIENNE